MNSWYARPAAAACVCLALLAASAYLLVGADVGGRESRPESFAVTIRHSGVDSREMERSAAVPLEDALAALPGVVELRSECEYGKARVYLRFARGSYRDSLYEEVSDAALRVYEGLPSSAQRPEIAAASANRTPVWVAALSSDRLSGAELARVVERELKPALTKLAGVGEAEAAGVGLVELAVELDEAAASAAGLSASAVARILASGDRLEPAGSARVAQASTAALEMVADGRLGDVPALRSLPLALPGGASVRLGDLARVAPRERRAEAVSSLDGKPVASLSVLACDGAELPALSKAIAAAIGPIVRERGLRLVVLNDLGAELGRAYASTLGAALQAAFAVAAASLLLTGAAGKGAARPFARRARAAAVVAVPVTLIVAAAALVATGVGLDGFALAGLALGLGVSVDAALLSSESLGRASSVEGGAEAMRGLTPSLAAGAATTIVVLAPMAELEGLSEGAASTAAAIAASVAVAFLFSVAILPPLAIGASPRLGDRPRAAVREPPYASRRARPRVIRPAASAFDRALRGLRRSAFRALAIDARACARRPLRVIGAAGLLGAVGAAALAFSPVDAGATPEPGTLYARLEFEPGLSPEAIDGRLAPYAAMLRNNHGVEAVLTTARLGSGSAFIRFDPRSTSREALAALCRSAAPSGAFVWSPSAAAGERLWEATVSGDDDAVCRREAERLAELVSRLPFAIEVALNFKEGPEIVVVRPDRERASALGVGFARAAEALRRGVHGPVAYKRVGEDGETDVRVSLARGGGDAAAGAGALPSLADLAAVLIPAGDGAARADAVMDFSRERDAARIHRRDRRRVASITIRSAPMDPRVAGAAVVAAASKLALPPGYAVEFDRAALEAAALLRGAALSFICAAALAYMAVAALTESFGAPLAIVAVLPPSLAVPAILLRLAGAPLNAALACAFVAVSGMAVNASVLTVEERRAGAGAGRGRAPSDRELYRVVRARLGSLLATSATSVAGSLPFLFMAGDAPSPARALAFVAATGTAASLVSALTLVPALARAFPGLFEAFNPERSRA